MPMIGGGDGDGVNILVLEQLANIDVRFWLWQSELFDVAEAMIRNAFIHIAEGGKLCSGDTRKAADMIVAAAAHSANGHADAVIGTHDFCIAGSGDAQSSAGDTGAGEFQKIAARSLC